VPQGAKLGGKRLWSVDVLNRHIEDGCPRVRPEAKKGKAGEGKRRPAGA
jgi:hypothetical protein